MTRRSLAAVSLALLIALLWCYWPVRGHQFIDFDDPNYVSANPWVLAGLTGENVVWAITTLHFSNWHPLTWLSHMLDVEVFGGWAGGHLLTNLALHAANCILVLLALRRMTGSIWRSAIVVALFGLHPLRVESVAWVSERKDLLCLFFGLLATWSYAVYAARRGLGRYVLTVMLFGLGLMAKPMLVTLPMVFLLLDWWPLRRIGLTDEGGQARHSGSSVRSVLLEKVPMMALVAASATITIMAQSRGGAVKSIEGFPLEARLANAAVSYVQYLKQTLWPVDLCVFYPHPGAVPIWTAVGAIAILSAITIGTLLLWRSRPHLIVGWLWFLGTLVPVIGIIQVGDQARADRYTMLPHIGLFIMVAWSLPAPRSNWSRIAIAGTCLAVLVCLAGLTRAQVRRWRDTPTLFGHALAVTDRNYVAHYALGHWHLEHGSQDAAVSHLRESLDIKPRQVDALNDMGLVFAARGQTNEALAMFEEALHVSPRYAQAHHNIGDLLAQKNRLLEAEAAYRRALEFTPDSFESHYNLAVVLIGLGRREEAAAHLTEVLRLRPDIEQARARLREIRSSPTP